MSIEALLRRGSLCSGVARLVVRAIQDFRGLAVDGVEMDRTPVRQMVARREAKCPLNFLRQRPQGSNGGRDVFLGLAMLVVQVEPIWEQLQPAPGLKGHAR